MRDPGAGTAGWPYTGPPGDHFLWILECRSLADRDSLGLSLRGLGKRWSSGQQAPGRHAWPPLPLPTLFPTQERVTLLASGRSIRQEPSALAAHAGIRAGGGPNPRVKGRPYRDLPTSVSVSGYAASKWRISRARSGARLRV